MSINNDSLFIEGIIGSFEHTHIIGKLTLSRIDNSNGLIGKVVAAEYNAGSIGDPVDILLFQCSSLSGRSCNNSSSFSGSSNHRRPTGNSRIGSNGWSKFRRCSSNKTFAVKSKAVFLLTKLKILIYPDENRITACNTEKNIIESVGIKVFYISAA